MSDTKNVYFMDKISNKWILQEDLKPKENFHRFSSTIYIPKGYGIFIVGGQDDQLRYSKKCLWLKKYRHFYEKSEMIEARAFSTSLYY